MTSCAHFLNLRSLADCGLQIETLAWADYLLLHPRPSTTHRLAGPPRVHAAYAHIVDRAWASRSYVARAITDPWPRMRPVLALSPGRLVVGAGEQVLLFPVAGASARGKLGQPTGYRIHARDSRRDVSALCFLPPSSSSSSGAGDGREAADSGRTLLVGRADGLVQRLQLSADGRTLTPTAQYDHPASGVLALSCVGDLAVTAARNGTISFLSVRAPWAVPSRMQVQSKPWAVHLSPGREMLAVGTVGPHPLNVYSITPSGPSAHPTALAGPGRQSAVYGICQAPPGSLSGSCSSQVLVSGWYDGVTRIHDLRQKGRAGAVLALHDPWDDSPVYSVTAGGGGGVTVAAGSSRHGIVRLWDVRQPKAGWSAFSPGKDASPVYALVMEASRVFGVTEARAFVFDFDPRVQAADYPPTPVAEKAARREGDKSLLGEWTPHYSHGVMKIDTSKRPVRRDRRIS